MTEKTEIQSTNPVVEKSSPQEEIVTSQATSPQEKNKNLFLIALVVFLIFIVIVIVGFRLGGAFNLFKQTPQTSTSSISPAMSISPSPAIPSPLQETPVSSSTDPAVLEQELQETDFGSFEEDLDNLNSQLDQL